MQTPDEKNECSAVSHETPLGHPKIEQVELEELFAHRIAESARGKVFAYFGVLGVVLSVVLGLWGWDKIDSAVDARIKELVDPKLTNAQQRVEHLSQEFEQQLNSLRQKVETRSSEFYNIIGVSLSRIQATSSNTTTVEVDISASIGPIKDQGPSANGVGYAFAYALRAELARAGRSAQEISPHGIYIYARKWDEFTGEDHEGTSLTGAVTALERIGAYALSDWPAERQKEPRKGATPVCRITAATALRPIQADEVIRYLRDGRPVVVGLTIYSDTLSNPGGLVTVGKNIAGLHAVCVVGYSERKDLFKVAYAWTTAWGDGGFGYIAKKDLNTLSDGGYVIELASQ